MTAPLAVSQLSERLREHPAYMHAGTVRAQLLAEAAVQASTLARCTTAMGTSSRENSTDLGRAMNALRMYAAREALEEIEGALARVDAGTYGVCQECARPIPLEHLATIPQARFCAACPTAAASTGEGNPEPARWVTES
jgi:RNA polymerase-binding transcription factor DksA